MTAYYNENDRGAAAWLRELIKAEVIAPGDVDDRSIEDVRPNDLTGYKQCHFFAGIGGWSYALRLAGWPDDRPVWTGSCPCQPFSQAGRGLGTADERHLWPVWRNLILERHPPTIFGEQVASPAAIHWLAFVQDDMEGADYAFAPFDLPAASVGAPNIRQRIFFVANSCRKGLEVLREQQARTEREAAERSGAPCLVGHAKLPTKERQRSYSGEVVPEQEAKGLGLSGPWSAVEWIACRDGKARPIEPGTSPLAHGIPGRVGLLRGYGNAINPQLAAEFIRAYMSI